ncbi:hypothetical protein GCM10023340_16870 [Nocardioides marinquilinus]|uniref:LPXTG cell wall anchor domain-containing protein n=1 Tax=Nocardioides marinquilinus TaxID=1210400 RepID=A0ABP9PGJ3_9ACTN
MIVLVVGVLVALLGLFLLRRAQARQRSRLDTANNLVSGVVVIVIGAAMVLFGLLELVG